MNLLLLQRGRDPDWIQIAIIAVFFLMPVLGRILRAITGAASGTEKPPRGPVRSQRRPTRPPQDPVDGEDLWRRLLRGEELPAPRPAPARPVPARPAPPVPDASERPERELAAPLSVMGEVGEPGEVLAVTLETEQEPMALDTLAGAVSTPLAQHPAAKRLLDARGLGHAILAAEILGPPVSLRRP